MLSKRWLVAPPASPKLLATFTESIRPPYQNKRISPILAQLLYNRGLHRPDDAREFLFAKPFKALKYDPFKLKDMSKAVRRINEAVKRGQKIAVYGDFDADGVTSTTLMMKTLTYIGADAIPYIPHRVDEGYGLNTPALQQLARDGIKLVVTVDCGIRSVVEVADGKRAGLDIIITDHHSVGPELPAAYAVVNPQQEDCDGEPLLAGVGVAFMVARAILLDRLRNGDKHRQDEYADFVESLLDLVAIGTVADIMPLNIPLNRVLVRDGLAVLNKTKRPGLQALIKVAGLQIGKLSAYSIGFGLAPRINAAGRLDSAMLAYELLACEDMARAEELALQLQKLNTHRQDLTRTAQELVREQIKEDALLIIAKDESFQPGIVGLVAGRLTEEYYRPAIIMERGADESHGSCRSIPPFNITRALDECADLLIRHGGHAMAAGFAIANKNLPQFEARMAQIAQRTLGDLELMPALEIDMPLDVQQINEDLERELRYLEPLGHQNPQPTFVTYNLRVIENRKVGGAGNHLKLKLEKPGFPPLDAIAFDFGHYADTLPERIDVVYTLEMNQWNGNQYLQLNIQDLRPSEAAI